MTYQDKAGRYVRVSIEGPTLRGNRQFEFKIRYWSSSSQVWNNYGQDIIARFATTAETKEIVVGTLWGNSLGSYLESNMWQTTYTYTAPSNVNFIDVVAITKSRDNGGDFYAQTDGFRVAQCYATSPNITNTSANSCTLSTNIYNPFDEEFKYQDAQGNYQVKNLSASSSTRAVSFTVNNMPPNSAYSNRYYGMILPNGSSNSFYAWNDSGTYKIKTSYSKMSVPTITVTRDPNNPTTLNVSWPAGGTTNKPSGDVNRIQYVVAKQVNESGKLINDNMKWGSTVNLEVAGTATIENVSTDVKWGIYAEYRLDGLGNSSTDYIYEKTNTVYLEPLTFNPYLKINNEYKKCNEGYIKVNGKYKKIEKAYIKVNGKYKEIN